MPVLDAAERLKQDVDALLEAGRNVAGEYGAVGSAFRRLLLADLALSRMALVRGLVLLLVCALAVGTAWVTAMTMLIVGLWQLGLPWMVAFLVPLTLSLAVAWVAWQHARKSLSYSDFDATRRQLALWFPDDPPLVATQVVVVPPRPEAPGNDGAGGSAPGGPTPVNTSAAG